MAEVVIDEVARFVAGPAEVTLLSYTAVSAGFQHAFAHPRRVWDDGTRLICASTCWVMAIVLMHDGGGNRTTTIDALPVIRAA